MKIASPPPPLVAKSGDETVKKTPPPNPQLVEGAQAMESMFLDTMFQVMRKTVPKSEMDLENSATKIYRSMLDSEVAQNIAKGRGVGLADLIVEQAERNEYNHRSGAPRRAESAKTVPGTGGTDESF